MRLEDSVARVSSSATHCFMSAFFPSLLFVCCLSEKVGLSHKANCQKDVAVYRPQILFLASSYSIISRSLLKRICVTTGRVLDKEETFFL